MNKKLTDLYLNITNCNFHLIEFTETWLKPGIFDNEILNSEVQIFRLNRIGGGIIFAAQSAIPSEDVLVPGMD